MIVTIEPEVALPFVLAYCARWGLRTDNIDRSVDIWWWGYVERSAIRAVMGLQLIEEGAIHVWGWLGDGSGSHAEKRGLAKLRRVVDRLPERFDVTGTILIENLAALRHAKKLGWEFHRLSAYDGHASFVLGRPREDAVA